VRPPSGHRPAACPVGLPSALQWYWSL